MKRLTVLIMSMIILSLPARKALAQDVGDIAPDFTLQELSGATYTLSDERSKVVFLFFLGYGCPFCRSIGPSTESDVEEKFGSNENFLAIGLDTWNGTKSQLQGFKDLTGITYPLLLNASGVGGDYKTTYDRVWVVDQYGKIAFKGTQSATNDLSTAIIVIDNYLAAGGTGGNGNTDVAPEENNGLEFGELYPNPASHATSLSYRLNVPGKVTVGLTNIAGQTIKTLEEGMQTAGDHTLTINTLELDQGIYFLNIEAGNVHLVRKLSVIR